MGNLENDDMFSAVEPIEPPEMALSEDEDDYWGSFKGIASWQRVVAKEHTAAMEARATGAAGQAAAQHTYSWPLPSAAGAPPVTARMPPQRSAAMPRKSLYSVAGVVLEVACCRCNRRMRLSERADDGATLARGARLASPQRFALLCALPRAGRRDESR